MDEELQEIIEQQRIHWPESFHELLTPFFHTLHRAHGVILGQAFKVMGHHDLSPAEFDVLASLRRSAPPHEMTPSQLQKALLLTSGGLTKVLQELERRHLITRSTAMEDRRVKPVRLTVDALPLVEQVMNSMIRQVGGWIETSLSSREIEEITIILLKLTKT
ncbi:MAG: MarR family transcriptional regulator [Magnetococcales bacterium]|nr:MarR family transcriptional regulator [Magnetococcales bacterium]